MFKSVDFRRIAKIATPPSLRGAKLLAFLYSAMSGGIQPVNASFVILAARIRRNRNFNGQTVYLEAYLNSYFSIAYSPATRAADIIAGKIIYIEDGANIDREFIPLRAELAAPLYLPLRSEGSPVYLSLRIEEAPSEDFIINIPAALPYNENNIRNLVDTFKIASKRYNLTTY